ncbi:hypothetical protein NM688_g195 [Phlebia brevispora]|uniref:Uncharacterized protein n=1 Tax=Phlebia brevispora TaxID=194682 RepID=A0ACC1TF07_9APHY|nr:hypothetical protein NM688_g195 [Phlebia brevispora]
MAKVFNVNPDMLRLPSLKCHTCEEQAHAGKLRGAKATVEFTRMSSLTRHIKQCHPDRTSESRVARSSSLPVADSSPRHQPSARASSLPLHGHASRNSSTRMSTSAHASGHTSGQKSYAPDKMSPPYAPYPAYNTAYAGYVPAMTSCGTLYAQVPLQRDEWQLYDDIQLEPVPYAKSGFGALVGEPSYPPHASSTPYDGFYHA